MDKFAIVKINNAQYKVTEGMELDIQKITGEAGDKLTFNEVLLLSEKGDTKVGTPTVSKSIVTAELMTQKLGPKINMLTYKAKARSRRRIGHRQPLTTIKITTIK